MITTDTTYDSYAWNILDIVFPSNFYLSDTASYRKTKYGRAEAYKDMQVETQTRDGAYYVFDMRGIQVNMRLPEVRSHVWSMMRQDLLWTATEIRSIAVWQRTAIIQSRCDQRDAKCGCKSVIAYLCLYVCTVCGRYTGAYRCDKLWYF